MKRTIYINSSIDEIPEVQSKVKARLEKWKIRPNDIVNADHALKELLTKMIEASSEPQLKIEVHKLFGDCIIRITGRGTPLRDEDIPTGIVMPEISEVDSEQESIIRAIIIKSYGRKVSFHNKKGLNIGTILVETSKQRALHRTLGALFGGIIFGIVIKAITSFTGLYDVSRCD